MILNSIKKEKILLSVTFTLIFLRDMQVINVPFIVFSAILFLGAIILSPQALCTYVICLVPFCRALPYSEMLLIVLCVTLIKMFQKTKKIHNPILYIFILLLVAIEVLGYCYWNQFSMEIVYLAVYLIFTTYYISEKLYKNYEIVLVKQYIVSTLLALLFVIVREINTLGIDYIITYNVRFGANLENIVATNFNSNEMGLYAVIAVALALLLFSYTKKVMYVVEALIITLLGMMSISRTFMLMVAIVWIVYLIKEKINIYLKILIFILVIATVIIVFKAFPDITEWIQTYFQKRSMQSGGRSNLLSSYFDLQFSSLYGVIFGYTQMYLNVFKTDTAVHNAIQEMIISWGIIGTIICFCWIIMLIVKVIKSCSMGERMSISRWLPIAVFLIYIQAIQFFSQHNYVIIFLITLVGVTIGGKARNERSNT